MSGRTKNRSGLIMVEAALAVVVLAIGVLAVFVLFSSGLDTRTRASADTQAALLATSVFNTLRAESVQASRENRWEAFWDDFSYGSTNLPVPAGGPDGVWVDTNLAIRAGELCTNRYVNYSLRRGVDTSIVDHVLRYRLDVCPLPPPPTGRTAWKSRYESGTVPSARSATMPPPRSTPNSTIRGICENGEQKCRVQPG